MKHVTVFYLCLSLNQWTGFICTVQGIPGASGGPCTDGPGLSSATDWLPGPAQRQRGGGGRPRSRGIRPHGER